MLSKDASIYRLVAESDEYQHAWVEAVAPTWRDVWKIVRGRYTPALVRRSRMTMKGADKVIREVWTDEKMSALYTDSPLLKFFETTDSTTDGGENA